MRRGAPARSALFTIVFRPAAVEKLDRNMVNINIPRIPKKASDQNPTAYYFACMRSVRLASVSVMELHP